jgi:hypothetical protein
MELTYWLETIDRNSAWKRMARRYHPGGPICPKCSELITGTRALFAYSEMRNVYCRACQAEFSATAGTPIHATSWQPEQFVRLVILSEAGMAANDIAALVGKSTACVRDMLERLELACPSTAVPVQTRDKKGARREGAGLDIKNAEGLCLS